jgi:opacity protein-like surface antigen
MLLLNQRDLQMLKKIILFSLSILFITTIFADEFDDSNNTSDETLAMFKPSKVLAKPESWGAYIDRQTYPEKMKFNPFLIGVSGGLDINYFEYRNTLDGFKESGLGAVGGNGNVTFGLGGKFDSFYLGISADASLSSAKYKIKDLDSDDKQTFKIPYGFGIYFVPGFFVNNATLVYLKLGQVYSEFKAHSNMEDSVSFSKNIWGTRGGLGMRYYFNRYFSLNGEYVFTYYQRAKHSYDDDELKITPITNQFNVGFAVHF